MVKEAECKNEEIPKENEDNQQTNGEKDEKDLLIEALETEITNLKQEIEKIKKAAADVVNRSKQLEVDRKYASSDLVRMLLTPLSYFEGALKLQTDDEAFNNFLKGFEMIYNLILDTLKNDGLKEIETKVNDHFDPRIHEVHELIEVEDCPKDIVLEIIQKGFTYKERVIKPVQVKVSTNKKEDMTDSEESDNENSEDIVN